MTGDRLAWSMAVRRVWRLPKRTFRWNSTGASPALPLVTSATRKTGQSPVRAVEGYTTGASIDCLYATSMRAQRDYSRSRISSGPSRRLYLLADVRAVRRLPRRRAPVARETAVRVRSPVPLVEEVVCGERYGIVVRGYSGHNSPRQPVPFQIVGRRIRQSVSIVAGPFLRRASRDVHGELRKSGRFRGARESPRSPRAWACSCGDPCVRKLDAEQPAT